MNFRKLTVGLLCVWALAGVTAANSPKPGDDWLVGVWVLCDDPDNSPKDTLEFNADGTGLVIRAKGNIEFLYRHAGHSVSLLANANGYAIPIELSVSPDFEQLFIYSDKTGSTASYVRTDSPQAAECSIT